MLTSRLIYIEMQRGTEICIATLRYRARLFLSDMLCNGLGVCLWRLGFRDPSYGIPPTMATRHQRLAGLLALITAINTLQRSSWPASSELRSNSGH